MFGIRAPPVAAVLARSPLLAELNLEYCEIGDEGMVPLLKTMPASIRRLNLRNNKLGMGSIKALATILQQSNTRLEYLNVGSNDLTLEQIRILMDAVKTNTSITHLDLSNNELDDARGVVIIKDTDKSYY